MAFVQAVTAAANNAATVTPSITTTTGRTLLIFVAAAVGNNAVNSITQSSGTNNYFARPQAITNATPGFELWMAENITGFTGTLTINWSASGDHIVIVVEDDEPSAFGGVANIATGNAANASGTITPSDAVGARYYAGVVYNNTSTFTAGTGTLRAQQAGAGISLAVVENTGTTLSVTHANGTYAIGIIEIIPNAVQGGNVWTSGGTESANDYWGNFQAGASFTTGANGAGYRVCVVKVLCDGLGGNATNFRAAIYSNAAEPNKARLAFNAANVGAGINAGVNTRNMVAMPLSLTLAASTTYWATANNDLTAGTVTHWENGSTTIRYIAQSFGTPPSPWGATTTEASGGHFWATLQAIASAGGQAPRSMQQYQMRRRYMAERRAREEFAQRAGREILLGKRGRAA